MRWSGVVAAAAIVLALTLNAAACSGQPETIAVHGSSATGTPGSTRPSIYSPGSSAGQGAGAAGPSGAASPFDQSGAVKRTRSHVQVRVGGQTVSLVFDTAVAYPIYTPPDGPASVTWQDSQGNALSVSTERLFFGAKRTSAGLSLTLAMVQPKVEVFNSGDGSCTVTFSRIEKQTLAGSFRCTQMSGSAGSKIDAAGTFTAVF